MPVVGGNPPCPPGQRACNVSASAPLSTWKHRIDPGSERLEKARYTTVEFRACRGGRNCLTALVGWARVGLCERAGLGTVPNLANGEVETWRTPRYEQG